MGASAKGREDIAHFLHWAATRNYRLRESAQVVTPVAKQPKTSWNPLALAIGLGKSRGSKANCPWLFL
jgi:hypothetical protein